MKLRELLKKYLWRESSGRESTTKDTIWGWLGEMKLSRVIVKGMGTAMQCDHCRRDGEFYQWAYFDKNGNLIKGKCVHGMEYKSTNNDEQILEDSLIDDFKFYVERENTI